MANRPMLPVESRMQGDLQVRFGGRLEETYRRKAARRFLPSLRLSMCTLSYIFLFEINFVCFQLKKVSIKPENSTLFRIVIVDYQLNNEKTILIK